MSNNTFFQTAQENPDNPDVLDVSPEEVLEKKDQLVLIDVRRPDEYVGELGHIPGAKLLTLDHLPQKINSLPKNETIVFVCRSGGRSGRATAFAKENGFSNVYNMKGGMILWNQLGFEVEDRNPA